MATEKKKVFFKDEASVAEDFSSTHQFTDNHSEA